ncbi:ATP-dependent DNA helicase RecG [Nodosilinea nodulosa]|uniref:ATP-dependent DNA helicase RecG n=1 Tax=Nodosilinea nodulosa TaxID=416001 RepID=UPI0002D38EEB|nr:ATP-dependent DNA helicase RecG [Nodosilinea nodulosa]
MADVQSSLPDWVRLQRALSVEAETGFNDLVGKQQSFSEFLRGSLRLPPPVLPPDQQQSWQSLAQKYDGYGDLSFAQRQHLVAETRRFLHGTQRLLEKFAETKALRARESAAPEAGESALPKASRKPKATPKTTQLAEASGTGSLRFGLDQPVTYLKGIGPKNSDRLAKLGLFTVQDVLFYYPRDHINYAQQVKIRDLEPGETVTVVGTVKRVNCFTSPRNKKLTIFELQLSDGSATLKLNRFYPGSRYATPSWQQQQKRQYPQGAVVAASGLVKDGKFGVTLDDPHLEVLDSLSDRIESLTIGRMVPVYSLTEGVAADLVRKAVAASLPAIPELQDPLPVDVRQRHGLLGVGQAIAQIHFPDDEENLAKARRRLVFDEFFYLQLGLLRRRQQQQAQQTAITLAPTGALIDQFYQVIPFQLTNAQQRVVNDILADLQQPVPMNRLVQGDVGSGKTVVAVVATLAAIQAGYQAALMAPTEVLAEQHYRKLVEWFNQLHLPVELLTGSTRAAKRRKMLGELATGELPILVGTHALIEDPVQFRDLGLVVIDEQHRFGVQQRARLTQKGANPHVLTLTATPIPRTLTLTMHGDLDVSQIDELPPGRKAIQTTLLTSKERPHAYDLIKREIAQGRQVYVVLPLVEESEKLDLKSAVEEHQRLAEVIFPEFTVGLLHGRMSSAEKDAAITAFRNQESQVLVSTTVVEVGVDVPNASVMLIEHAERFGLSQLHQLRGRVGRGAAQSFCLLLSSSRSEQAIQRLKVLEQSQDGFFIAEMDLRFRGPGEVLGTRQSGLPDFALASLIEDQDVLMLAREAAEAMLKEDPTLARWPKLAQELQRRYEKLMGGTMMT